VVFDRHPEPQPLNPGSNLSFRVVAAGYGTLSYQWKRDGLNLVDGRQRAAGPYRARPRPRWPSPACRGRTAACTRARYQTRAGASLSHGALLGTPAAGDLDGDGDIDIEDSVFFADCMSGRTSLTQPAASPRTWTWRATWTWRISRFSRKCSEDSSPPLHPSGRFNRGVARATRPARRRNSSFPGILARADLRVSPPKPAASPFRRAIATDDAPGPRIGKRREFQGLAAGAADEQ